MRSVICPPGTHAALTRAFGARVRDHGPVALALRARAGGHDLAEERALDGLDLTPAATDRAGVDVGARRRAGARARAAEDGGVDGDLALGAEHGVGEVDADTDESVLAAARTRDRAAAVAAALTAEEGVHDVGEGEAGIAHALAAHAAAVARQRVAAHVVPLPLPRVGQHPHRHW